MIILHAALVGEELLLWGESPPLKDALAPKGKRAAKTPATPTSPFDAGAKNLKAALGQMGLGLKLPAKRWGEATSSGLRQRASRQKTFSQVPCSRP